MGGEAADHIHGIYRDLTDDDGAQPARDAHTAFRRSWAAGDGPGPRATGVVTAVRRAGRTVVVVQVAASVGRKAESTRATRVSRLLRKSAGEEGGSAEGCCTDDTGVVAER